MKKIISFHLILLFSIFSFAQNSTTYHKTTTTKTVKKTTSRPSSSTSKSTKLPAGVQVWTVDAQRAKCEGAVTMQCLLVKQPGKKTFELFYDDIQGFDYQEGSVYTIWVKQNAKTPPIPVNASPYTYSLVKVVSKKVMPGFSNTFSETKKPQSSMNEGRTKTFIVNEEKAPCSGGEERRCLLVKEEGKKTFELLYSDIQGFTFERGFRQTILVNESYQATASGTSPVYTLVRVISREAVQLPPRDSSRAPEAWAQGRTALDKKWFLRRMKDTDTSSFTVDDNAVWLQFITAENRFNGNGPCNTFIGGFKSDLISTFQASAITNSKIYCANIKLEEMFFTLLQNADNFVIKDKRLIFSKGDRLLLEFESR